MLNDTIIFMREKSGILKRALVTNKKIIAWSSLHEDIVIAHWKEVSNQPLRLVPMLPLEGGETQETWNKLWDISRKITKKIRQVN